MRAFGVLLMVMITLAEHTYGQSDSVAIRTEKKRGIAYKMSPSVNPVKPLRDDQRVIEHEKSFTPTEKDTVVKTKDESSKSSNSNAIQVEIGRNFEGTHLYGGTPSDNSIAVSNGRLVVAFDNNSYGLIMEMSFASFDNPMSQSALS